VGPQFRHSSRCQCPTVNVRFSGSPFISCIGLVTFGTQFAQRAVPYLDAIGLASVYPLLRYALGMKWETVLTPFPRVLAAAAAPAAMPLPLTPLVGRCPNFEDPVTDSPLADRVGLELHAQSRNTPHSTGVLTKKENAGVCFDVAAARADFCTKTDP
jgi:hypothetical protein